MEVYVNGTLTLQRTNLPLYTRSVTPYGTITVYAQTGQGDRYLDDFAVGNTRISCAGGGGGGSDTTPPTQVTGASANANGTQITIQWTNGTDAVGVAGQNIKYCTGTSCTPAQQLTTLQGANTSYSFNGSAGTTYGFQINNFDAAGNQGAYSSIVYATTGTVFLRTLGTKSWNGVANGADIGTEFDDSYTGGGPAKVLSNRIMATSLSTDTLETYNAVSTPNDQWAQVDFGAFTSTSDSQIGVLLRAANSPTMTAYLCYALTAGAGAGFTSAIGKFTNGSWSRKVEDNTAGDWLETDSLRCEIQGNTISLSRLRGTVATLVLSYTDTSSPLTSGKTGLYLSAQSTLAAAQISQFSMGDFDATPPAPPAITGLTTDATGLTATWSNNPASFRLNYGSNSGLPPAQDLVLFPADFVSGRYNIQWPEWVQFACLYARNASGTENTTDYRCAGVTPAPSDHGPQTGVLRHLGSTPWLTNDSGNGIYLGGISGGCVNGCTLTPNNPAFALYQDIFTQDAPASLTNDYAAALAAVQSAGLNMIRAWIHHSSVIASSTDVTNHTGWFMPTDQLPFCRTGTRTDTTDSQTITVGVYDLTCFNQAFFDRVRTRTLAAVNLGITPSIVLYTKDDETYGKAAIGHPFYANNNVNGVNCDTNANGVVEECYTLVNTVAGRQITAYQDAFVKKMVDTLNDIHGIIWEPCNECQSANAAWLNHIADTILTYEATGGRNVHPVYISPYPDTNANIIANARAAIAGVAPESGQDYETNPPVNTGSSKPILFDSDHSGTGTGSEVSGWPWKLFTRGVHVMALDGRESAGTRTLLKQQIAQTITYANKMHLAGMLPVTDTSIIGTGYGLMEACTEYLSFRPNDGNHTFALSGCGGMTFSVEFLNVVTGAVTGFGTTTGGATRTFNPAGSQASVVYLKKTADAPSDTTPPTVSAGSPSGTLPSGTTSVPLQVSTSEPATCKYGTTPGTAYGSIANTFTTTGGVTHTQTISTSDGATYTEYVRCQDEAGNATTQDYVVTWSINPTPAPPDLDPPVRSNGAPSGVLAAGTTSVQLYLETDENATCRQSPSAGVAYASMTNQFPAGQTGETVHTQTQLGLTTGTYTYYIKCIDEHGNANPDDYVITFAIAAPVDSTPPTIFGVSPVENQSFSSTTTTVTLTLSTNEPATCKYGSSSGVAYASQPNTFESDVSGLTTTHTQVINGLTQNTSGTRYARCQDANGNPTTVDTVFSWTIQQQQDIVPPVLSNPLPNTVLPAGTTSVVASFTVSELASCRWDTTEHGYADMPAENVMSMVNLKASVTVVGLTDNSTTIIYGSCTDFAGPVPNMNTTAIAITIQIAADTSDTTPPTAPSDLTATPTSQTTVSLIWTESEDDNGITGYNVWLCADDACAGKTFVGFVGNTTLLISQLFPDITYQFCVTGLDPSNNESACSNVASATTPPVVDTTPPSDVVGLVSCGVLYNEICLRWEPATDNVAVVGYNVLRCTVGLTCPSFTVVFSSSSTTYTDQSVQPATEYQYYVLARDTKNISANPSNTVTVTTVLPAHATQGYCLCRRYSQ